MSWKPGEDHVSRKRKQPIALNGAERLCKRIEKRALDLATWMSAVTLTKAVLKW